jgi:hypothetical protein
MFLFHKVPPGVFINRLVCVMGVLAVLLTRFVSEWFILFSFMIFLNFFQSSFSWGICPPTVGMRWAGWIQMDPELGMELVYLFKQGVSLAPQKVATNEKDTTAATDTNL